jgi:hypothetical protein
VPASWWSGWSDPATDDGLLLESGASYCVASIAGLDWFAGFHGEPAAIMTVGFPDLYGRDTDAGVAHWAAANDAVYLGFTATSPNTPDTDQTQAVAAILGAQPAPDVVLLATGPRETGEIVARTVAGGYEGRFLGLAPSWSSSLIAPDVDPEARQAVIDRFVEVSPWPSWGAGADAYTAMEAALGADTVPANDGFTAGWILSYPLKALLEAAATSPDGITRDSATAAIDSLVVDYQGALPERNFGAEDDAPEPVVSIVDPDPEQPLGMFNVETAYSGSTMQTSPPDLPCASPS